MPTATGVDAAAVGRARAWGWVWHLRDGGTTSWSAWLAGDRHDAGAAADLAAPLPGAQQLELLRRLNLAGRPRPDLARRVLASEPVGRGRHDLELVGVPEPVRFGPAPVDPGTLPADDLLRVATSLLAQELTAADPDPSVVPRGTRVGAAQSNRGARRVRRVRRRYRLVGDPVLTGPLRAALVADGRPPGGKGAAVHVLGTDLATMLAHAWTTAAFAEGGPSWPDYLAQWQQRARLPRRVDLPAAARRWRERPGTGRVDVVLDLAALPRLVGLRRDRLPDPPTVAATAADLARRTSTALGLLVATAERDRLLATVLRPRLEAVPGPLPVVPPEHRAWVDDRATLMRRRLRAEANPVVGAVDGLLPRWTDDPGPTVTEGPLDLAVRLLLEGVAP